MPTTRKYANIYQPRPKGPWFARITVPADVRGVLGQKLFQESTGETSPHKAHAIAAPKLAEWRGQIEAARKGIARPIEAEIDRLTTQYCQAKGVSLDDAASLLVGDVLSFVFQKAGGVSRATQRVLLMEAGGDVEEAVRALPAPTAGKALGRIMGTATPFLAHFEDWKAATYLKKKTLAQAVRHIEVFAASVSEPIETLAGGAVQKWIERTISSGMNPKTINSYLYSIRRYWEWMQDHDLVPITSRPFWDRKVASKQTEVEKAVNDRTRFEPEDVVKLLQNSENDKSLHAMIMLAAYTGARRESLAALTNDSIIQVELHKVGTIPVVNGISYIHFSDKTKNGIRDVPIHSAIAGLIKELVENAGADGYLISETSPNKYGSRGDALGKRFTRLKRRLKFGSIHTFHSIRHTVAHLLESAECPEGVAQDMLGHKKASMTFGLYSGVSTLQQKRYWIEKAIVYPTAI